MKECQRAIKKEKNNIDFNKVLDGYKKAIEKGTRGGKQIKPRVIFERDLEPKSKGIQAKKNVIAKKKGLPKINN